MIKFNIDEIIDNIADALGTTYEPATTNTTFREYVLPNVIEEDLIEYGFEFVGLSEVTKLPLYVYENLQAHFDEQILHIYEVGD